MSLCKGCSPARLLFYHISLIRYSVTRPRPSEPDIWKKKISIYLPRSCNTNAACIVSRLNDEWGAAQEVYLFSRSVYSFFLFSLFSSWCLLKIMDCVCTSLTSMPVFGKFMRNVPFLSSRWFCCAQCLGKHGFLCASPSYTLSLPQMVFKWNVPCSCVKGYLSVYEVDKTLSTPRPVTVSLANTTTSVFVSSQI